MILPGRVLGLFLLLAGLYGCSSLLPSEQAEARSPFNDYLDAEMRYSRLWHTRPHAMSYSNWASTP